MLVSVNYLTMLFKTSFNPYCSQVELLDNCNHYCVRVNCDSKLFTNLVRNLTYFVEVWLEPGVTQFSNPSRHFFVLPSLGEYSEEIRLNNSIWNLA